MPSARTLHTTVRTLHTTTQFHIRKRTPKVQLNNNLFSFVTTFVTTFTMVLNKYFHTTIQGCHGIVTCNSLYPVLKNKQCVQARFKVVIWSYPGRRSAFVYRGDSSVLEFTLEAVPEIPLNEE